MKVIDLYNKIANSEKLPKKIKYKNCIFENRCPIDYWCREIETCLDELILMQNLNDEVEILEEKKKTIDDLNLSLQEIEAFQEARQIFLKLNNEEDKQTFIKLLLGEGTYERWIDYLNSKGDE